MRLLEIKTARLLGEGFYIKDINKLTKYYKLIFFNFYS